MSLAGGKVAVCLEGGYNLKAISKSALAVAKTLMGEPPERMSLPPLNKEAAHTIDNVIRIQSRFWESMRASIAPFAELKERGTERASDVIRRAQMSKLNEKYNMIPLFIQRNKLSTVFENQVLVTPGLHVAKKILIIIHDPWVVVSDTTILLLMSNRPDFQAQAEPEDNITYAHNAFVVCTVFAEQE